MAGDNQVGWIARIKQLVENSALQLWMQMGLGFSTHSNE